MVVLAYQVSELGEAAKQIDKLASCPAHITFSIVRYSFRLRPPYYYFSSKHVTPITTELSELASCLMLAFTISSFAVNDRHSRKIKLISTDVSF